METISERDLAALLAADLTAIAPVRWGWKALETAELPPSLPLVTLQRTLATAAPYVDMCADPPMVDTTIQTHVWHAEYENARDLNAQVRSIIQGAGGWVLQAEVDEYDGVFRAWRISGEYLGSGMTPE
jgi:hypothetical protein